MQPIVEYSLTLQRNMNSLTLTNYFLKLANHDHYSVVKHDDVTMSRCLRSSTQNLFKPPKQRCPEMLAHRSHYFRLKLATYDALRSPTHLVSFLAGRSGFEADRCSGAHNRQRKHNRFQDHSL
jgi:hypothetical protein